MTSPTAKTSYTSREDEEGVENVFNQIQGRQPCDLRRIFHTESRRMFRNQNKKCQPCGVRKI